MNTETNNESALWQGEKFPDHYDVKPETPVRGLSCEKDCGEEFSVAAVAPLVGMELHFMQRVVGKKSRLRLEDVYTLLEQDAFHETFIPRSLVVPYLRKTRTTILAQEMERPLLDRIVQGDARRLIGSLPDQSIQCTVTSTPYWAMRVYEEMTCQKWADGEVCPLGLEQTPEGFIRHSIEILVALYPKMTETGSVWWNVMDTYNTRTQIRSNAVEALRAMQGKDRRVWREHPYKRYSGGHSFLKDGEQCMIPYRIAERASRIGYYVKSVISWCKTSSLPEPQNSRVSRNVEYILHLAKTRTPLFQKERYREAAPEIGGRQATESEKLSDYWFLPTSAGREGHGAQFPVQLPGRCILLSTNPGDIVLDPFAGAGTTLLAAKRLGRRYLGFDVAEQYVRLCRERLCEENLFSRMEENDVH